MAKLYHYCSIETLECILKYKTIRFSSLSVVDDMEEAMTSDFDEVGRVCFVSCWTDKEDEDIAMWRTYTEDRSGKKSGVRLSISNNLFDEIKEVDIEILEEQFDVYISPSEIGVSRKAPILFPVTYTKDNSLIELSVHEASLEKCDGCGKEGIQSKIKTSFLGKFKRDIWNGQSEWRYKIIALPKKYHRNNIEGKYNDVRLTLDERINLMNHDLKTIPYKYNYIDFPFKPEALNQLEIVSSPLNTPEDNSRIQSILHEYVPGVHLSDSKLKVRSRNN